MKANNTDTQGQASAEILRGVLLRLRWMAPVLIFGLAALLVLGFYVMALRQVFSSWFHVSGYFPCSGGRFSGAPYPDGCVLCSPREF